MPVKDADRAEFEAFSDLGFDSKGREVLVGLSYEETEWYLEVLERDRAGAGLLTKEESLRRSALNDRHSAARLKIVEQAHQARFNTVWGKIWRKTPKIHPGAAARASANAEHANAKQEPL
jgi:hypothetical protein